MMTPGRFVVLHILAILCLSNEGSTRGQISGHSRCGHGVEFYCDPTDPTGRQFQICVPGVAVPISMACFHGTVCVKRHDVISCILKSKVPYRRTTADYSTVEHALKTTTSLTSAKSDSSGLGEKTTFTILTTDPTTNVLPPESDKETWSSSRRTETIAPDLAKKYTLSTFISTKSTEKAKTLNTNSLETVNSEKEGNGVEGENINEETEETNEKKVRKTVRNKVLGSDKASSLSTIRPTETNSSGLGQKTAELTTNGPESGKETLPTSGRTETIAPDLTKETTLTKRTTPTGKPTDMGATVKSSSENIERTPETITNSYVSPQRKVNPSTKLTDGAPATKKEITISVMDIKTTLPPARRFSSASSTTKLTTPTTQQPDAGIETSTKYGENVHHHTLSSTHSTLSTTGSTEVTGTSNGKEGLGVEREKEETGENNKEKVGRTVTNKVLKSDKTSLGNGPFGKIGERHSSLVPKTTATPHNIPTTTKSLEHVIYGKLSKPNVAPLQTGIPGNLHRERTPFFVYFTFDDGVNSENSAFYKSLFSQDRTNSNGCPIAGALFVSDAHTNYQRVKWFYDHGWEIADHSITHRTPTTWWKNLATYRDLKFEIDGMRDILASKAGIPAKEIAGMRTPFLATNRLQIDVLENEHFQYDSSATKSEPSWPYRVRGHVWEIPLNLYYMNSHLCGAMLDTCRPANFKESFEYIFSNFKRHYDSPNRAPFGINMHAAWFLHPAWRYNYKALDRFIQEILKLDDVWIVTPSQLLNWVKNPVSVDNMEDHPTFTCHRKHHRHDNKEA
ncbi:uncharacterized protein LOC106175331 [Lingula anatina]|uniref:Uncharacterized protein LOC106175331 n=1 Tax=Lingula anatina TaxID=7574 RepID=A0A1S3JRK7_LINAN|nr:uncharacterized protein LOC106175331 [Lingula anatina]|eukprot:XP_013412726.1 uncharacterized protein LOC106175331 [Lingula anatina]